MRAPRVLHFSGFISLFFGTTIPTSFNKCVESSGCDNIGPKLLKHCALALSTPLHHLFSLSLSKQLIPCEWKCHSITPIFKSGDKSLVKNYRPISLLCIVSKVLERLIYNKISKFITDNNILCCHQFGFRQNHSSTQQLLIFFLQCP